MKSSISSSPRPIDGRQNVASIGRSDACDSESRGGEVVSHTLKGASANVGASALAAVCAGLETQARMGHLDSADRISMEQFDIEFARAREAFNSLVIGSPNR